MMKVEFDEDGYPLRMQEDEVIPDDKFTEEDYAFLDEFRELMEEFQ